MDVESGPTTVTSTVESVYPPNRKAMPSQYAACGKAICAHPEAHVWVISLIESARGEEHAYRVDLTPDNDVKYRYFKPGGARPDCGMGEARMAQAGVCSEYV